MRMGGGGMVARHCLTFSQNDWQRWKPSYHPKLLVSHNDTFFLYNDTFFLCTRNTHLICPAKMSKVITDVTAVLHDSECTRKLAIPSLLIIAVQLVSRQRCEVPWLKAWRKYENHTLMLPIDILFLRQLKKYTSDSMSLLKSHKGPGNK